MWRNWCLRHGLVDDPGHRKIHHQPVPLAGGLAVLSAMLLTVLGGALTLWIIPDQSWSSAMEYGLARRAPQLLAILAGATGMVIVGCLDDKHELRPGPKFLGQAVIACMVAASDIRITLFIPSVLASFCLTVLWILTVLNAINFMDNMNGLSAGLGAIGAAAFGIIAAMDGQYLVALIAFVSLGALIGFIPYNFPHARVFLGDAGSHLVGFILAVLAILPHFHTPEQPRRLAVLIPLLVLALPLLDMVRVVLFRWRIGQPFYQGDNNHVSHILVKKGLSPKNAVLLLWLATALFAGLAVVLVL
ncbi:MAG TPA: MraY family glycosyltransferase [Clostridia bacterium]|nr:MraY family glycosyltransferase [Clostridia bacterium]